MKSKSLLHFVPLAALFAVLLLAMPRGGRFSYEYRKGTPWKYETLVAPFDFPVYKSEAQLSEERNAASGQVLPYFRFDEETAVRSLSGLESLDMGGFEALRATISSSLRTLLLRGVADDGALSPSASQAGLIYIQRDKRAAKYPVSEVYRLSEARARLLADLHAANPACNADSLLRASGAYALLVPDLLYDAQATEYMHSTELRSVSPTSGYVRTGETIVEKGELVTAELAQVLDSYKKEYEQSLGSNGPVLRYLLGNGILALVLVLMLYFAIRFSNPEILEDKGRYLYLILITGIFLLLSTLVPRIHGTLVYVIPFTLCALFLEAFFDNRLIITVYSICLLPLLFYADSGVVLFVMFLTGGVVSIFCFKYLFKGWRQFLNAFITFLVLFVVYLGFHLTEVANGNLLRVGAALLAGSMLSVAGYPLTYLFERIFNLVSVYRLSELCDTSGKLLQILEKTAPGTFQHSLQVMNMADAAARAIGADTQLIRAGALYHDIGKIQNPLCFVENESMLTGEKQRYHSELSPLQSAQDIVRHVSDGLELAHRHYLPSVVSDFIRTHHGTSTVSYFYDKYLTEGGDPAERDSFRYPGPLPVSREQIILMLCDSIEAASRTLKDYSREAFSDFVEQIVAGKMQEGQFDEAGITVRELGIVKEVLKSYLGQMYHERIAYPKRKNK
ncbi:MAG: HDIG domain-containing protein [Bacteroidales bacterium]|nr:HDIG domain-containing protein [Bacteroidales bacterium]